MNWMSGGLLIGRFIQRLDVSAPRSTVMRMVPENSRSVPYLHADAEEAPKDIYAKLGFLVVDKTYEYVCTDLTGLALD